MKIHVVRLNETIQDIGKKYNISQEEIKKANPHFRSWENIAPGAKINLPSIPEYLQEEIDNVEPFIEDYYPTIDIDTIKQVDNIEKEPIKEEIKPKMKKLNYNNMYSYYYNPYDYYRKFYSRNRK